MQTPNLQHKSAGFAVAVKASDMMGGGDGFIAGYASTFGPPPDLGGDIVERGAYSASLKARPSVPVLWQHDLQEPIGKTTLLKEDEYGLLFKAKLTPTRRGRDAQLLTGDQVITTTSIGYDAPLTRRGTYPDEKRRLVTIDLFEISLVTYAMNPGAQLFQNGKRLILDALTIAEVDDLLQRGFEIPKRKMLAYIDAQERKLELSIYGKSRRALLNDVCFELQQLSKIGV